MSAVLTKHQYKTYISSLVRLLVGEQLQLKWIKKGSTLVTKDFHLFYELCPCIMNMNVVCSSRSQKVKAWHYDVMDLRWLVMSYS